VSVVSFRRALRCAQAPKAWKERSVSARHSERSASYKERSTQSFRAPFNHCRQASGSGVAHSSVALAHGISRIISQTHLLDAIRPREDKRQSGNLITLDTRSA